MQLIPQYTRITNYKKLVDRFITSQAITPSDPKKSNKGKLFALIEILNPWHPNAQIGQTIINTLSRAYYNQSNSNELLNFENALKKVNEKLVEITQRGETDWIGKINATLVLVANNKIHLAYTGKIKAYLWRSGKIMPIIDPKETYTYNHPLKTFSSVVSGDLKINDKMFFSTNMLFDFIDNHKLEQLLSEKDTSNISTQIASILRSRNTRQANCIVVEMSIAKQDFSQIPEVVYLDQEQFAVFSESLKKSFGNFKTSSLKFGSWFKENISASQKYYNEKIVPKSKELISQGKKYTQNHITKQNTNSKKEKIVSTHKTITKNENDFLNVNHYNKSIKKTNLYFKKISDYFWMITRKISNFIKLCLKPKNRSKTFIIIALILLLIFIANIGLLKKVNQSKENIAETEAIITDLENKKDDASLAIITGDTETAEKLLNEVLNSLNDLSYDSSLEARVNNLKTESQEKLDSLSQITRLTNPEFIDSYDSVNLFSIIDDQIITINPNTSQIQSSTIKASAEPKLITTIPESSQRATAISQEDSDLFIYTNQKSIYNLSGNTLKEITNQDDSWQNAVALANYVSNLYLLDSSSGQIYKYTPTTDGYSKSTSYLDSTYTSDIKDSVDITIDGNIYVLKANGDIVKIISAIPSDLIVKGIPDPNSSISNAKKIYTQEAINSIYILDGNRILEIDKNGNYISQFAFSEDITNIDDFYIIPDKKELYILANNQIYKYNY